MSADEIIAGLKILLHRIAPEADLDGLDPSEELRQALDIDSFDYLNFLVALSERFGVEIPESDYGKVTTLESLTHYLLQRIPSSSPT